ncbi:MAG: O-antigen ligase family protein [Clostridia bacterium]|nr:O-antigen ligase family protein [Clostridia bacterium]
MSNSALTKQKIRLPMIMMCMYFLAVPLSIINLPGGFSLLKATSVGLAAVMIPLLFVGDNEIKLNGMHLAWTAYLIYSFSTMFLKRDDIAIDTFRGFLEVSALAILVSCRVYNQREKRWIYNSWILVGLIMVVLMTFTSGGYSNHEGRETIVLLGNNEDPNQINGYFLLPIIICIDRVIDSREKNKSRIVYVALIIAMLYCVVKSGSRGGLAAVMVTVLVYSVIAVKGLKNRVITAVVITLTALLLFVFIIPHLPQSLLERFDLNRIVEDRATNRFDIWLALINDLKSNIGSFTWGKGFYSTAPTIIDAGLENTVAHNHIIQVLYDQGIVGCVLFLIMIVTGGVRMLKKNSVITVALLGIMSLGMSITMYAYYKIFWNILIMTSLNFEE